ncbi:hypothetical protein OsJ_31699 [Oryza sativa Japonica Group]|uniref:Uncharacterized protein n=2 Tax=Oryza TaxID=4527 RepID=B9G5Z6_ORYSJ|nr:hypothetical protein OsJ_31699 [Oryza sativa Japonica Group]
MALMFRRQMFVDDGFSDKPHGCASPEPEATEPEVNSSLPPTSIFLEMLLD